MLMDSFASVFLAQAAGLYPSKPENLQNPAPRLSNFQEPCISDKSDPLRCPTLNGPGLPLTSPPCLGDMDKNRLLARGEKRNPGTPERGGGDMSGVQIPLSVAD